MNIVIIGAGASGLTAASNIRKYDDESQIIVFTTQKHVAYSPCAIPYVIGGHIDSFDDIIMHKPEEWFRHYLQKLELSYKSKGMNNEDVTNYAALSPAFVKETKAYTATVPYSVSSITVNTQTYIPDDEALIKASTEPNTSSIADGTYSLNLGRNVI